MNCDPLARWYRTLEYLGMGRALERRRFEFLPLLKGQAAAGDRLKRALVLGDGDGRFLAALLAANPGVQADYVDSSARMLELARARVVRQLGDSPTEERVRFFHADALAWLPSEGKYDLVATHFFLDCLDEAEVAVLLNRLKPSLAIDTVWIVSEFHQPSGGFAGWRARLWIGGLYRAFGWLTGLRVRRLPAYRPTLESHGFALKQAITAELGLLVSEWWERDPP